MNDELLIRALIVLPVAVLLPLGLPKFPRTSRRALLAGAIALGGLAGGWLEWQTWAVIACAVATAAMPVPNRNRPWGLLVVTAVALAVTSLLIDSASAIDGLRTLADDWRVVVVAMGGLACVFVGGAAISTILHPFAVRVGGRSEGGGMEHAGRVIGWIERALLYGLVLLGAPDAAALVIAGKSIARFPSFKQETFAEYYLIGSLLSLSVAIGVAIAVRAIIGLEPVAPL